METQNRNITYLNREEKIIQFFSESDEIFNDRLTFLKKLESETISWKEASKLSKIYVNVKYKKCKYSPQIYYLIKKYI